MAAIGSRFNSLLLNAQDPLEQSKRGPKKPAGSKSTKRSPKKESLTPEKASAISSQSQKKSPTPKTQERAQSQKGQTIAKDTSTQSPTAAATSPVTQKPSSSVKVTVRDINKPVSTEAQRSKKPETKSDSINDPKIEDSNVEDTVNPKDRTNGTYKKMLAVRGKMHDRHGVLNEKTGEKRQGRGAYNWGDRGETSETRDQDTSVVEQNDDSAPKEEYVPICYTLEQYRQKCNEKILDPLHWKEPQNVETVLDEKDDFREYEYHRTQGTRGRGQSRGSRGGRGRGQSSRPPRSDNRERHTPVDVKIDDPRDFPAL